METPLEWDYTSRDAVVKILARPAPFADGEAAETTPHRYLLEAIHVSHPALITVTSTPSGHQTLYSLHSNQPILTTVYPANHQPSPLTTQESKTVLVTFDQELLTPAELEVLRANNELYSTTYHLILDGPSFPPPHFDPLAIPSTPYFGPSTTSTTSTANYSPSLSATHPSVASNTQTQINASVADATDATDHMHRLLLSPLLTPHRRAAPVTRTASTGTTPRLPGLYAFLPPLTNSTSSIEEAAAREISRAARIAAEEMEALRVKQEEFVKRVRAEQSVLEARVKGYGKSVAGFSTSKREDSASLKGTGTGAKLNVVGGTEREESLERSPFRLDGPGPGSRSTSRGRRAGGRESQQEERDQEVSRMIKEEDDAEESRGRSTSRSRRQKDTEVREAEKVAVNMRVGQEISATMDDEEDEEDEGGDERRIGGTAAESLQPTLPPSNFIPTSHTLVPIDEAEEFSLGAMTPHASRPVSPIQGNGVAEDEEPEPFEMDEDIDFSLSDSVDLPPRSPYLAPSATIPTAPVPASSSLLSLSFRPSSFLNSPDQFGSGASLGRRVTMSTSRPPNPPFISPPPAKAGPSSPLFSMSPRTSSSKQPPPLSPLIMSPSVPVPARPEIAKQNEQILRDLLASDATSYGKPLPLRRNIPPRRTVEQDEESEEEDEDDDQESSRRPPQTYAVGSMPISIMARPSSTSNRLIPPSNRRPIDYEERELQRKTSVPTHREGMWVPRLVVAGAVPTRIIADVAAKAREKRAGVGSLIASSSTAKADVVVPPPISGRPRTRTVGAEGFIKLEVPQDVIPPTVSTTNARMMAVPLSSNTTPGATTRPVYPGSSSLAQSLLHPPVASFAARMMAEEEGGRTMVEEEDAIALNASGRTKGKKSKKRESDEEESDTFIPPHEFVKKGREDEDLLSRSVGLSD